MNKPDVYILLVFVFLAQRKEEQVSPGCDSFSSPATATRGIHPRWALVPKGALQSLGTQTFKCSLSSTEITIICKLDFFLFRVLHLLNKCSHSVRKQLSCMYCRRHWARSVRESSSSQVHQAL